MSSREEAGASLLRSDLPDRAVTCTQRRMRPPAVLQLARRERDEVVANCDYLSRLKFASAMPYAFTEHGALMAASVLSSSRAVKVSLFVVRAFVQRRETLGAHKELAYGASS